MEKLHPADIFESGRNKREVQFYVSDTARKENLTFQYQDFWPQSPRLSLPFKSHKQTCKNIQNPDVKNIVVVLKNK